MHSELNCMDRCAFTGAQRIHLQLSGRGATLGWRVSVSSLREQWVSNAKLPAFCWTLRTTLLAIRDLLDAERVRA